MITVNSIPAKHHHEHVSILPLCLSAAQRLDTKTDDMTPVTSNVQKCCHLALVPSFGVRVCAVTLTWPIMANGFVVWLMPHLLTWRRQDWWPTLQPATRWWLRFLGFTFGSCNVVHIYGTAVQSSESQISLISIQQTAVLIFWKYDPIFKLDTEIKHINLGFPLGKSTKGLMFFKAMQFIRMIKILNISSGT